VKWKRFHEFSLKNSLEVGVNRTTIAPVGLKRYSLLSHQYQKKVPSLLPTGALCCILISKKGDNTSMKTKIMAGVAIAAIAATGVVGGFALANGDLNSGVNATNSKTTCDSSNCGAYTDSSNKASTLNANYNGWTTKLSSGTLAGDSVVVEIMVGGAATAEEINLTSTANYCAATPDSGYGASVTFNAGCTGLLLRFHPRSLARRPISLIRLPA
jgi:hypothetical protein